MKCFKKIIALLAVFTLLLSSANAATVLVNEGKIDTRTEALKSSASRLMGETGYNPSWPGTHTGSHYAGITAPWAYGGAYTHEKVFGIDCDDLLFIDYNNTSSVEEMLYEPQMGLTTNDIAEWNGFLFVVCSGRKTAEYSDTEYFQYGNGKTVSYSGVSRSKGTVTSTVKQDSYLYVFDISRAAHYSEALVGKWSMAELGLEYNATPNRVISNVAVDDDYIYITLHNGSGAGSSALYDLHLALFNNNIDRENPDYIEGTEIVKAPTRAESADELKSYTYGAKQIYDYSTFSINPSYVSTSTEVINGVHILRFNQSNSMAAAKSTQDAMFYVNSITNDGDGASIADTKIHYGLEKNTTLDNASTAPMTSILQYAPEETWLGVTDPLLNAVVWDGDIMYALVSYKKMEGGAVKSFERIYVTDWSNPLNPKNMTMCEWEAESYSEKIAEGDNVTVADYLYLYDGYLYVSGDYGITILKTKDNSGEHNVSYVSYIEYDRATTGVTHKAYIVAVGNYLVLWDNYGQYYSVDATTGKDKESYFWGTEAKILLTEDKTEVKTRGSYGNYFRKHTSATADKIVVYGNRVYVTATPHASSAALTGYVEVINFEDTAPLELSVEPVGDVVTVPYKLSGKAFGLNAVALTVNGETFYVETKAGEGNYKTWEYEITEPGEYEIDAVGAVLKGFPNEATKEHISFTATVGGTADYSATYKEDVNGDLSVNLTVYPRITNNQLSGTIEAVPAVGVYSGTSLVAFVKGEKIKIVEGNDVEIEPFEIFVGSDYGEYSVKIYLLGGVEDITPILPAVTIKEK